MRFFAYTASTHIGTEKQSWRLVQTVSLIFTVCVFFFTPHRIATAQTVHIPDLNLRAVLESALGKEAGEDITQADMVSLKALDALKTSIKDLRGLEFATNLMEIELRGNRISNVSPLKTLTNLTKLRLGTNRRISDVSPLAGLTNLTFLDLDSNAISDVSPLAGLANLTWLDLDDNEISDVSPLTGLTNLKYLDLDGNAISDVSPLKALTNLTFLDIDDNEISDMSPLSVLIKLTVLDLEGNKLSDISPIRALMNLTELDLHDNEISDVSPLSVLTNLAVLDLSGNRISDFSALAGLIGNLVEYDNSNQTVLPHNTTDVNRDGVVNILDLAVVASYYGDPNFSVAANTNNYPDVNSDGVIDVSDLVAIAVEIDPDAAAPTLRKQTTETSILTIERLTEWIQHAEVLDTQSLYTQKGISVLKHLLAVLTFAEELPRETALLSNYPNPFNPETWIPYQLARSAVVTISIYSVNGRLVRTLDLGHLSAGIYHAKSRAAYWDGKNELGESVASGIYFYTLTAADFAATSKMLIQK